MSEYNTNHIFSFDFQKYNSSFELFQGEIKVTTKKEKKIQGEDSKSRQLGTGREIKIPGRYAGDI